MNEEMVSIDLVQDAKNLIGQANSLRNQLGGCDQQRNGLLEQSIRVDAILAFIRNKIGSDEFEKIVNEINATNEKLQPKK